MSTGQQLDLFDDPSLYEGNQIEFKGAKGGFPGSLWETYSSFANTNGGTIWLGVTEREDGLDLHGLTNTEKLLSDLWSTLHSNKVNINLLTEKDVKVWEVEGRKFIRVDVPRADRRERPVYIGQDPFKGTFRRDHEGDFLCNRDEVRRMFADQSDEEPADSRILDGFGMSDLDPESLKQYRNRLASRNPNDPWLGEDDKGLLTKLGGWRIDRRTGKEGLTVAGLLMFGKSEVITAAEGLPSFHLDYKEHFSDDVNIRWTDRLTNDGTWEGNLFQFYVRAMQRLSTGPGLKVPFQLDDEGVRQPTTAVHEALQEALVNALIHADHAGVGGVVIDRWVDRFEFSNPGTLLLSREQLLKGGVSECRNKYLQRIFQKLGIGDKAGSGLDKIRYSWHAQHWSAPELGETYRPDRVQLVLPMVSIMPEEIVAGLRGRFGSKLDQLSKEGMEAVVATAKEGWVTNHRLQEVLNLHRVDITLLLQKLVKAGFLVTKGIRRGAWYELKGGDLPGTKPRGGHPEDLAGKIGDLAGKSIDLSHKDGDLVGKTEDQAGKRLAPVEMRRAILDLCNGRYRSAKDLAEHLGRSVAYLSKTHIYPMVKQGLLKPKYPGASRPGQAYIAAGT